MCNARRESHRWRTQKRVEVGDLCLLFAFKVKLLSRASLFWPLDSKFNFRWGTLEVRRNFLFLARWFVSSYIAEGTNAAANISGFTCVFEGYSCRQDLFSKPRPRVPRTGTDRRHCRADLGATFPGWSRRVFRFQLQPGRLQPGRFQIIRDC